MINRWVALPTDTEQKVWLKVMEDKGMKGKSDFLRYCARTICEMITDPKPIQVRVK